MIALMFLKYLLPLIFIVGCGKTSSNHNPANLSDTLPAWSCSKDFRVLPAYTNIKNYLAFENFGAAGIGRCRGHSIVSQSMEMLARFNERLPHPCQNQDEYQCYTTMYELINKILNGSIQTVGGFDSLYTFSQDPTAQRVLRLKVASISHRYSASESPMDSYDYGNDNTNVFFDIVRRVKLRHRPYVGILGKYRIGNHALIAYKLTYRQKVPSICVRDPNIVIDGKPYENCQNFLYLKNGEIFYHQLNNDRDEELLSASLQTDEDDRVQRYIDIHFKYCQRALKK
jgi:hypothetical protein